MSLSLAKAIISIGNFKVSLEMGEATPAKRKGILRKANVLKPRQQIQQDPVGFVSKGHLSILQDKSK